MNNLQEAADNLLIADFSILPTKADKTPAVPKWAQLQTQQMTSEHAEQAFKGAHGIAVVCGQISGGLECIDFDSHNNDILSIFKEWGGDSGVTDIVNRNKLYIERSKSGGYHVLYRYESETYQGSQKLAFWEDGSSMIETKGEGGYVIVAPTEGYKALKHSLEDLHPISLTERDYLLSHARNFSKGKQEADSEQADESKGHEYTDPVSWYNWHKAGHAKQLLKELGWTVELDQQKKEEQWRRPGKQSGISATWGHRYNALYVFTTSSEHFKNECYYTPFQILTIVRFKRNYTSAIQWVVGRYFDEAVPYIRVGTDYFKKVKKIDRFGIWRTELKSWTKDEIKQDNGAAYINNIPKFDDFGIYPDNFNYQPVVENCYNLYKEFTHRPKEGNFFWSDVLMHHIFGEQYNLGLRYLQALYLNPDRALPILVLVSKERQTGKTTFLNWLNMIFGDNMVNISPEDLTGSFNHIYATSNIIAVEETLIEKAITVEKLKATATGKFVTVNQKFVQQYKVPFYGKVILASNNEDKFAKIDEEEIRFFIRKVGRPTMKNHKIEEDLAQEIPAFLHYLTTLPPVDWSTDRSGFTPEELSNESLDHVKKESKSWLYKDIKELVTELFYNHESNVDAVMATPADIKNKWFANNSKVDINYIRHVLKNDFHMEPSDKVIRYTPFSIGFMDAKVGRPFTFTRDMFVTKSEVVTKNESEEVPF